ncbi:acyl-CoA dehydrogenase family protein [Streptomyces sp. NPDC102364]|uniref:acyl-CoA dehydrogenase family protein n=1 Tax=Streptomyces sp. NPDC102364 TaxID=3366161 RepID=UPI003806F4B0
MNFELNDEQVLIRDSVRAVLADRAPMTRVRELLDSDQDVDSDLWKAAVEAGWTGLALPERFGGAELGLVELALLAQEGGRALARGPHLSTALVGAALVDEGDADTAAEVLPELVAGRAWAAWAFAEPGMPWSLDGVRAVARRDPDGSYVLDGVKTAVQDAGGARWILVTALDGGEPASFLLDRAAPGVTVSRQRVLDPTRTFYEVRLAGVRVRAGRRSDGGPAAVQRLLDKGSVLRCADALGTMERLLELTVEHTSSRVQFGRPIGSFQAVKHGCSDMALTVHGAFAATYRAAMAADHDPHGTNTARAVSAAAAFTAEGATEVAGRALQLHGGIGFTWEHDLHLYLRRARADAVLHGDAAVHQDRLCTLLATASSADTR